MRAHGYCERCHKIKMMHVTNAAMVRLAMNKPIFGECDDCHRAALEAAKGRHPSYRARPGN